MSCRAVHVARERHLTTHSGPYHSFNTPRPPINAESVLTLGQDVLPGPCPGLGPQGHFPSDRSVILRESPPLKSSSVKKG